MIAVKRVLVPVDFSEASDAALQYGIGLVQSFGGRLYLLHVPGKTGENLEADFPIGPFARAAREPLQAVAATATQLRPEYAIRIGTPADEILRYADDRSIDLIVMGTHGRSGVAHLVMGSVAESVVRGATCPVMTLRQVRRALVESKERFAPALQEQT